MSFGLGLWESGSGREKTKFAAGDGRFIAPRTDFAALLGRGAWGGLGIPGRGSSPGPQPPTPCEIPPEPDRAGGSECDDLNTCTEDECFHGTCYNWPQPGHPCTSDGNPCTDDLCNTVGACTHPPNTGNVCYDYDPCTADFCVGGACSRHEPLSGPACQSDGDECTDDVCANGSCTHPEMVCPNDNPCAPFVGCCRSVGCIYNELCDDGDACTANVCSFVGGFLNCSYPPIYPPPSDTCAPEGCNIGWSLPNWIRLNNDDDNHNGMPDYLDVGAVQGENDLYESAISTSGCFPWPLCDPESLHTWSAGGYRILPFTNPNRTNDDWGVWPPPPFLYWEGRFITDGCEISGNFTVFCDLNKVCHSESPPVAVVKVVSLEWQKPTVWTEFGGCAHLAEDNAALELCPNNGGVRIFPDKLSPNDNGGNSDYRNKVDLVATITPNIEGVTVYFRVWDVDDPFDQVHGPLGLNDIANVGILDAANPTSGPDNRLPPEGFSEPTGPTYTAVTNKWGQARKTIQVSKQPGNNYRAAATCLPQVLTAPTAQVTQADADALSVTTVNGKWAANGGFSGYKCPVVWSQMLTVWRKLHVEFDTMQAEPQDQPGRAPDWASIQVIDVTPLPTTTLLTANGIADDYHQFEGGRLFLNALNQTFPVYDDSGNTVEISAVLSAAQITQVLANGSGLLKDDDPESGLLPESFTVDTFLTDAFKPAYVQPMSLDPQLNPVTTVPFDIYVHGYEQIGGIGWNNSKDQWSANDFWVTLVVAAYQSGGATAVQFGKDNDPDPLINNATYPLGPYWPGEGYSETLKEGVTVAGLGDWETLIFRAAIIDFPRPGYESHVLAHEIGHSGGNTGTEDLHHAEGGLQGNSAGDAFTGKSLKRFREAQKW